MELINELWMKYPIKTPIISILLLWGLKKIIEIVLLKNIDESEDRYKRQKHITIVYSFGILLVFIGIYLKNKENITTFFGFLTVGLSLALQDVIRCIAGWWFIIWRKPFSIGDRIEIGEFKGDVVDIRPFQFSLLEVGNWVDADQSTGRVLHIPNSLVLTGTVANFGQGFEFIWNEISILITFESDWKLAKKIATNIVNEKSKRIEDVAREKMKESAKKYMIIYKNLTPIVYTSVKDSGVMLSMRYLVSPRQRRGSEEGIWEAILDAFAKHANIDFAYPTQRFYNNNLESKEVTNDKNTHK